MLDVAERVSGIADADDRAARFRVVDECASSGRRGSSRQRMKRTSRSAVSSASNPGMLSLICGLIVQSAGSMAKRTVHLNPWRERIFAIIGIDSSERYDSSAAMKTMCLPFPAPCPPGRYEPRVCAERGHQFCADENRNESQTREQAAESERGCHVLEGG